MTALISAFARFLTTTVKNWLLERRLITSLCLHPVLSYPNWSLYHIHPKLSIVSQLIKLLVHKIYCSWYQVPVYLWRIKLAGKPWNYLYYVVAFENVCNIFPGGNTVNCQNIMARVVAETYLTFPHSYMPNFWKRKSKGNLHIVG